MSESHISHKVNTQALKPLTISNSDKINVIHKLSHERFLNRTIFLIMRLPELDDFE